MANCILEVLEDPRGRGEQDPEFGDAWVARAEGTNFVLAYDPRPSGEIWPYRIGVPGPFYFPIEDDKGR